MAINQFAQTKTIGTSDTILGPFLNYNAGWIANLDLANATGGSALNSCKIQTQASEGAPWRDYFGGSDWSSATDARNIFTGTNKPPTLAAGSGTNANIIVCGVYSVRIVATVASGTAHLTVHLSWSGTAPR